VFGPDALDFVEIDVDILSAHRGQAGDPTVDAGRSAEKILKESLSYDVLTT
jgi:hypothetical protein